MLLDSVVLTSSLGTNMTIEDLTVTARNAQEYTTLIYDWKVNGTSMAVLKMPFGTDALLFYNDFDSEVAKTLVGKN